MLLVQQRDRDDLVCSIGHSTLKEGASALGGLQHGVASAEVVGSDSLGVVGDLGRGRSVK